MRVCQLLLLPRPLLLLLVLQHVHHLLLLHLSLVGGGRQRPGRHGRLQRHTSRAEPAGPGIISTGRLSRRASALTALQDAAQLRMSSELVGAAAGQLTRQC